MIFLTSLGSYHLTFLFSVSFSTSNTRNMIFHLKTKPLDNCVNFFKAQKYSRMGILSYCHLYLKYTFIVVDLIKITSQKVEVLEITIILVNMIPEKHTHFMLVQLKSFTKG